MRALLLSALPLLSLSATGFAQPPAGAVRADGKAPSTTAPALAAAAADYAINGFRTARFGMTPAEVRTAIAADFAGAAVTPSANPAEGTTTLEITLPALDPAPGIAHISYIFGAASKTLSHVNVLWRLDGEPTTDQRSALLAAALQLTNYFTTQPSAPKASTGMKPSGPNALLLFAAVDQKGAGVELSIQGISYQTNTAGGGEQKTPPPAGPALLRIAYSGNAANPDIRRIQAGSF